MCTVSMVGDHYRDMWEPKPFPQTAPAVPMPTNHPQYIIHPPQVSREEFDELKRQVLEMKELLKRAKKYDEDNGEKDCELDEKMALLRKVAEMVGVNLDDVIGMKS